MNEVPPGQDDADEVDELYRRASALDDSRPNELVRRRVLQHAAQLAAERAAQNSAAGIASTRAAQTWRRPAIFGTLAAAAFAGLLIVPQFLNPSAPPPAASPPAMDSLSREAVVTTGAVQEAKQSREDVADEQLRSAATAQIAPRDGDLQSRHSGRMAGNRITSRMCCVPVRYISSRSMPIPTPPVGGIPYSMARR